MTTSPIENVIVVMLENRSYDNILGGLYLPTNAAPYNQAPSGQANLNGLSGLTGADGAWNPNPAQNPTPPTPLTFNPSNQTADTQLGGSGTSYPPTTIPLVDPGEFFSDMAWQITGAKQTKNPYSSWSPAASPQPAPPPPSKLPSPLPQMAGFTEDYASQSGYSSTPPAENIPDVMNYFTPAQTPVTAWLSNNFAVCDQWFASAPTQTFANRAFAHCAAPAVHSDKIYSLIDDAQYAESQWDMPSIFYLLDQAFPASASTSPNWKVYFHDYSISMLTVPYVMAAAMSPDNVNVATYDDTDWGDATPSPITKLFPLLTQTNLKNVPQTFLEDLAKGTLPKYSFIEPRYSNGIQYGSGTTLTPNSNPPNSNHPGGSNYPALPGLFPEPLNPVSSTNPPIDVANGEAFLLQLYNALYSSNYWDKTLLIITYDEHGGCYDHVPPPVFTPPSGQTSDTALGQTIATKTTASIDITQASDFGDGVSNGFQYNVYGCRVPAIIVSPYIAAGTQITAPSGSMPFDHASIISTIRECLITPTDPSATPLTNRDALAPSLVSFLTSSADNNPGTCNATD